MSGFFKLLNIFSLSGTRLQKKYMIQTKEQLEEAALNYGILPFFPNVIRGFSVEEMAAPGKLFGGANGEPGCWEWKGPVIQEKKTAYGKFFNKKAGFIDLELLPHFLNYRRSAYKIEPASTEQMILDIIKENYGINSTDLRKFIFGYNKERTPDTFVDILTYEKQKKRHSIEGPLQRLQMSGRLLIADFEYKVSKRGERYGWGVALYSTPEMWFERDLKVPCSPVESLQYLVNEISKRLPRIKKELIYKLLK